MPFTKQQLLNITQSRGQSYIAPNRMNYAGRVAESYIRKKTYSLEDKAAVSHYTAFKQAYGDIQRFALQTAYTYGIDSNLKNDRAGLAWRRKVIDYTTERLNTLVRTNAETAYKASVTAYKAGYYGRQWLLASMTQQRPKSHRLDAGRVGQAVLDGRIQEALDPAVFALYGSNFEERYQIPIDKAVISIRSKLTNATAQGQTVNQALKSSIAAPLGISSKPNKSSTGAYHQTQVTTRESVMTASNAGAIEAYKENESWILAIMYLTARDSKVCSICAPLDGFTWPIADFWTALIGLGVAPPRHYGCRCGLIPVLIPSLDIGSSAPPDDTFDEWLDGEGYGGELDDFITDTRLESSQV